MLKPSLQFRLGTQLTMTPQLQQAIRLLQLPLLELRQTVNEALEQNPLLEARDEELGDVPIDELDEPGEAGAPDDDAPGPGVRDSDSVRDDAGPADAAAESEPADDSWDDGPTATTSDTPWSGEDRPQEFSDDSAETLHEYLLQQLRLSRLAPRELAIGEALVDAINDDGWITDSLEMVQDCLRPDLECGLDEIERVLGVVQAFDPAGVGARSLGECIELQLSQLAPDTPGLVTARAIAREHLELVREPRASLRRALGADDEELDHAVALVRSCHPRPGSTIQPYRPDYVVPDVYVRRGSRGWEVELNSGALPKIRVNPVYAKHLTRDHGQMRDLLKEARWLIRSLEIRNDTLLTVARCIVDRQAAFLEHGEEAMRPMVLRDVAEAVEKHEATISRITTGKYMHTPRGVFEFRYFFSSHVAAVDGTEMSSVVIRAKIRKLIESEDPGTPLSDSRLAELLAADGAQVARRTVAKYREAMKIAPSSERRVAPAR
jgi:RNA polymerase sigma-54 factor